MFNDEYEVSVSFLAKNSVIFTVDTVHGGGLEITLTKTREDLQPQKYNFDKEDVKKTINLLNSALKYIEENE